MQNNERTFFITSPEYQSIVTNFNGKSMEMHYSKNLTLKDITEISPQVLFFSLEEANQFLNKIKSNKAFKNRKLEIESENWPFDKPN